MLTEEEWVIYTQSMGVERPLTEQETAVYIKKAAIDREHDERYEDWLRENNYVR